MFLFSIFFVCFSNLINSIVFDFDSRFIIFFISSPWHRYPISLSTGESLLRSTDSPGGGGVRCATKGVKQRVHECRVETRKEDNQERVQVRLSVLDHPEAVASDHYATMGLYKLAEQSHASNMHSGGSNRSGSGSNKAAIVAANESVSACQERTLIVTDIRKGVMLNCI